MPNNPAETAQNGALGDLTRLRALEQLIERHPSTTLLAFDGSGNGVALPAPAVKLSFNHDQLRHVSDFIVADNTGPITETFERALKVGGCRTVAELPADSGLPRSVTFLDLRLTDYGCVIAAVSPEDFDVETPSVVGRDLRPRQAVLQVDSASIVLALDKNTVKMFGYSADYMIGRTTLEFLHEDDHERGVHDWVALLEEPGGMTRHLLRYRRADGEWFWAEVTHTNLLDERGYVERQIFDVDERVQALKRVENRDRVIEGMAQVLPSGVAMFDARNRQIFCNDRWREITGILEPSSRKNYPDLVIDPKPSDLRERSISAMIESGSFDIDITLKPATGGPPRRCQLSLRQLLDENGLYSGMVSSMDDITDSWLLQQRLTEQATTDDLTGLLNRSATMDHLDATLATARSNNTRTAVIFIDLNNFKRVNDVLGHGVGDKVLVRVAETLRDTVRPTDLVARHGGDEFLVVCENVPDAQTVTRLANRLLAAASGRLTVDDHEVDIGASIGVAIDHDGTHTAERMIAEADLAMYAKKRSGASDIGLFKPEMFHQQRTELNRDAALRHATTDGSLVLHYQPIVNLKTGATVGYEALLRWMFEGEMVFPDGFIGLAERRGVIVEIGDWVIDQVAQAASEDPRNDLLWTLNVSPVQLRSGALDEVVLAALDRHDLDGAQLGLEVTESTHLSNSHDLQRRFNRLRDRDISLLVDDFGTGFASMDYLRTLPVNGLKVDRTFTNDLSQPRTEAIISNILGLADMLDLRTVVEGIETAEQRDQLIEMGAEFAQGYFFGRPVPLEAQQD